MTNQSQEPVAPASSPLRDLLDVVATSVSGLAASLQTVYDDAFVGTADGGADGRHGLDRGVVQGTEDPEGRGRWLVQIGGPDAAATWAEVVVPLGGTVSTPDVGAVAWVGYEGADPGRPVVIGLVRVLP